MGPPEGIDAATQNTAFCLAAHLATPSKQSNVSLKRVMMLFTMLRMMRLFAYNNRQKVPVSF